MLKAVLFDLDNTLVDRERAFRACVQAHFHDTAAQAEILRLDQGGYGDRDTLFKFWEQQTAQPMNQAIFGELLAERLQPDRDLIETLRALSAQLKLGIITNGGGETQRRKIQAAGLDAVIPADRVWISAELGMAKPDPAIFTLACRALGELPEDCLYIGDQEQEDHAGARAAGLRARRVDSVLNGERLSALLQEEQTP